MKKVSYDEANNLFNDKLCCEFRDNCFSVIDQLLIDRTCYLTGTDTGNTFVVAFFNALDCCNIAEGHADYTSEAAFLGAYAFDTLEEANEFLRFHLTSRITNRDNHDEVDLFNIGIDTTKLYRDF